MRGALVFIVFLASLAVLVQRRSSSEKFAELGRFAEKLGAMPPTGRPGGTWDAELLPTFYPQIPGYEGTPVPDPGFRTITNPNGVTCECPVPHPTSFRDTERDTVCVSATGQMFSSECAAKCYGYKPEQLYACKPRWGLFRRG